MSGTLTLAHLQALSAHLRRYQAEKAARILAEQRMQAAFGPDVTVTAEDVKVVEEPKTNQPAMAVVGN